MALSRESSAGRLMLPMPNEVPDSDIDVLLGATHLPSAFRAATAVGAPGGKTGPHAYPRAEIAAAVIATAGPRAAASAPLSTRKVRLTLATGRPVRSRTALATDA